MQHRNVPPTQQLVAEELNSLVAAVTLGMYTSIQIDVTCASS